MLPWTVNDVIARLAPKGSDYPPLPTPTYSGDSGRGVGLAVSSMRDHTTDEGWQLFAGLRASGYVLAGHGCEVNLTNVPDILTLSNPGVVLVQDKREWHRASPKDFRDPKAEFRGVECLLNRSDVFKVTVLKDSHQRPDYHRASAEEMGVHGWVVYYHPRIVAHLAPYVRPEHLVRTWHSVNVSDVPLFSPKNRAGCLLSGALSSVYPVRQLLVAHRNYLPETTYLPHPGYHRNGCATPKFLETLSRFKVALCTASVYGYALRKIVEATAVGCVVVTDLPADEVVPEIDGNLVRVRPDTNPQRLLRLVAGILRTCYERYDERLQQAYAERACYWYDYRNVGARLVADIEALRRKYP